MAKQGSNQSISEREGRPRNVSALRDTISRPRTPHDWRMLEADFKAARAREEALLNAADSRHAEYGGAKAVAAERAASDACMAFEDIILETPAIDLASLRFKMEVFDADLHGAEQHWESLREEINHWLGVLSKDVAGRVTVLERPTLGGTA